MGLQGSSCQQTGGCIERAESLSQRSKHASRRNSSHLVSKWGSKVVDTLNRILNTTENRSLMAHKSLNAWKTFLSFESLKLHIYSLLLFVFSVSNICMANKHKQNWIFYNASILETNEKSPLTYNINRYPKFVSILQKLILNLLRCISPWILETPFSLTGMRMLPSLATVDRVVTSLPSSVILRIVPTDTWWKQTYFNIFLLFEYHLRIKLIFYLCRH